MGALPDFTTLEIGSDAYVKSRADLHKNLVIIGVLCYPGYAI